MNCPIRPFSSLRTLVLVALVAMAFAPLRSAAQINAAPEPPENLRADIADGNTGQLIISWTKVSGAAYYDLEYSTSSTGPWSAVSNCFGSGDAAYYDTALEDTPLQFPVRL
ncbi:MAG: hypothetical protein WA609_15595 [Terriglobales bacterium]